LPYPFEGHFTLAGWHEVDSRTREKLEFLLAGAWINLAVALLAAGRNDEAGKAIERSLDFCELSGDRVALASTFAVYARWAQDSIQDPDKCLNWLSVAEAAGVAAGNVDAANSAALWRGERLISLGEYDGALGAFDRVLRRKALGLSREVVVEID